MNKRTIFRLGYCLTAALTVTLSSGSAPNVGATGASISAVASSTHAGTKPSVALTMQALAKLRSYGYTWTSDQGALKSIKAWQRANGLVVDGIVGPQTSASLGLANSSSVAGVAGSGVVPSSPATPGAPAVRVNPPQGSVEDIIRNVWPDELEDRAVQIATRESRLQPGVRNACCYGLFQIHWGAHHSWLADLGIISASQLFDAHTNAVAAYALYQRAGGWGPWGG